METILPPTAASASNSIFIPFGDVGKEKSRRLRSGLLF
jgi:hypothetical protein